MISVIIPTLNAQPGLAATLTALVPATVDGLVREVIVVDGGSTDRTAAIADEAGTHFVTRSGGRGYQLLRAPPRALPLAAVPARGHGSAAGLGTRDVR